MAEPSQFTTAALQLERAGAAGTARAKIRGRCASQAGSSGLLVQQAWRSPEGAGVAEALAGWRRTADAPDRAVTDAYTSLGHLATVARRTAAALDRARQQERNALGAAFDRAGEAGTRARLNLGDFLGLVSDDEAQHQRDELDHANRIREQAATEREAALTAWSAALDATATAVRRAIDELRRNTIAVPAALKPPATAPPPVTPPPTTPKPEDLIPPMPTPVVPVDPTPNDWNTTIKAPALPNHAFAQTLIGLAELSGLNNAARHLHHYMDNTGSTLDIDPDRVARDVPRAGRDMEDQARLAANKVARQAIAEGRVGQPVPFTSDWVGDTINQRESRDWFFAMGSYHSAATGVVVVDSLDPPQVNVWYRTHIIDRYNWDEGKAVEIGPIVVKDEDMGALHKAGLAKEFDMQGTSATHTMTLGPDGGRLEGGTGSDSPEHPGSRTDPGRVVPPDVSRSGP